MIKLESLLEEVRRDNLKDNDEIITLYLDMDGVLCDFELQFEQLTNEPPSVFERKKGPIAMWSEILKDSVSFWSTMQPMADFHIFQEYIFQLKSNPKIKIEILTSTNADQIRLDYPKDAIKIIHDIELGKTLWIQKYLTGTKMNFAVSGTDKSRWATKSTILVDDLYNNVEQFIASGGEGIVYRNVIHAKKDIDIAIHTIKETCGYKW